MSVISSRIPEENHFLGRLSSEWNLEVTCEHVTKPSHSPTAKANQMRAPIVAYVPPPPIYSAL